MTVRRLVVLILCTLTPSLLAAQTPVASEAPSGDIPLIVHCLKQTDAVELKGCVQQMAKVVKLNDELAVLERKMLQACLAPGQVELRECVEKIVSQPTPEREKRVTALDKALRGWEVLTRPSRLDGSTTIVLMLESEDDFETLAGKRYRPSISLRCMENRTSAYVSSDGFFFNEDVPVAFRLDKENAVAQTWQRSTNYTAAGLWDGSRAVPFVKSLLGKSTLILRVTTMREGNKEMAFNIAGLDGHIGPLRQACKW